MTLRTIPACLATVLLAAAAAAAPASAQDAAPDLYAVKISLSGEDPDVHTLETDAELVDFHVFVDGGPTRGAEFGVEIHGGRMVAYVIDTEEAWVALPMQNPYPGTIAQVKAGPDCFEPPVHFGRLMVQPDEPGGFVEVHVIPSLRAAQTAVIHCDQSGSYEVTAYHAAINGAARPPERIVSEPEAGVPGHDHAADHEAHGG